MSSKNSLKTLCRKFSPLKSLTLSFFIIFIGIIHLWYSVYDCFYRTFYHIPKVKKRNENHWTVRVLINGINITESAKSKQIEKHSKFMWISYHRQNQNIRKNLFIHKFYTIIVSVFIIVIVIVAIAIVFNVHYFLWLTPTVLCTSTWIHHLSDTTSNIYFILYVQPNITVCHL